MRILCFSPFGYEGTVVDVEVGLRRGIPAVDIVGLADGAVKESRERMRSAIISSGFTFPPERVLISLSPADVKKEGAGFDLAVALAVLNEKECSGRNSAEETDRPVLVMGELDLNGNVRPVKAVHAAASTAFQLGVRHCIVPAGNEQEAKEIRGMHVFGAESLTEAFAALKSRNCFSSADEDADMQDTGRADSDEADNVRFPPVEPEYEFSSISGQEHLTRALQIAASGGHSLLVFGPPGCGKTMSLQKLPGLLPFLTKEESQSVTRIFSIAGLLAPGAKGIRTAPFRQPHQTATIEGMCGGGIHCRPGEISLAHNGILFLDEAAEFRTSVLQMLRVPMETGTVTLSRAGRSTVFPADFQLLMSTNPCPCGNFGSAEKLCLCSARSIELYWKKFSAPLLDRIDLRIRTEQAKGGEHVSKSASTAELRKQIAAAVRIQRKRGKKNARLSALETKEFCIMTSEAETELNHAAEKNSLSQRAVSGCLKVARTIADMKEKECIGAEEISEAVRLRIPEGTDGLLL